ncbi:protein S100-A1-like [Heptranchias perlo]|uniref:protein S100-A1-like n=1 Tax=Heptranchias perlo TaxID=212740 RepID=UPI0035595694
MASQLEQCMASLITIFHTYSGKEGDKFKLNKTEMKTLLQEQFGNYLKGVQSKDAVGEIMKDLDVNGDQELDFKEFILLIASLTILCNEFFLEHLKETGKK